MIVDAATAETITDDPGRRLLLMSTTPRLTVTWTRHGPGQEGTDLHVHHDHTDAFFVIAGELTVPLGPDGRPVTLTAGAYASIPPGVAHAFVNASDAQASWLNLHHPDGGFVDFLRGMRDGSPATWDAHAVPADGGRPASDALVLPDGAAALREAGVVVLEHDARTLRLELAGR